MLTRVNSAIFWGFLELRKGEQNVLNEHKHNRGGKSSYQLLTYIVTFNQYINYAFFKCKHLHF